MASIHKDIPINAPAHEAWDAVRDFGAVHTRLAPGFVTDTKLEEGSRIVTFANGTVVRELFVDCDEERRRLVYAVVSERVKQHSASIQIFPQNGGCRLVWIADLLPHELAKPIGAMMQHGMDAMKKKLEADASAPVA